MHAFSRTLFALGLTVLCACDRSADTVQETIQPSLPLPPDLERFLHPTMSELMTEEAAKEAFEVETKLGLPESAVFLGAVSGTPEGEPFTESRYRFPREEVSEMLNEIADRWDPSGELRKEGHRVRRKDDYVVRNGDWFTIVEFDATSGVLRFSDEED